MTGYIARLEDMNTRDTRLRAVLKRSLAFEPGTHIPAFHYVEPLLPRDAAPWSRQIHYLVAGLWAAHWREGRYGPLMPLAKACAQHQLASGSASTERRFIQLLDADSEQLPHRLRQIVALLKELPLDFQRLLDDLLYWNSDDKVVQNKWARDFYRHFNRTETSDVETETAA